MNKIIRWMLFGVGIFGILACSPSPVYYDIGLSQFCRVENRIYVAQGTLNYYAYNAYPSPEEMTTPSVVAFSDDGGITWQSSVTGEGYCQLRDMDYPYPAGPWVFPIEQETFVVVPKDGIYVINADGTVIKELDLAFLYHEARLTSMNRSDPFRRAGLIWFYRPGAWDAIRDPMTGNTLFAMGLDGVLVRSATHDWTWRTARLYGLSPLAFPSLLMELLLMSALIPLYLLLQGEKRYEGARIFLTMFRASLSVFVVAPWLFVSLNYRASSLPYYDLVPGFPWGKFDFWALAMTLGGPIYGLAILLPCIMYLLTLPPARMFRIFKHLLLVCTLYITPYILWGLGILASHTTASYIAVIASIIGLVWCVSRPSLAHQLRTS